MVLPVPARPSSAITEMSGSSSSSSANRCSLLRGRSPQASGVCCDSSTNSSSTARTSADCEPERSTANSFSVRSASATTASMAIAPAAYRQSIDSYGASSVVQPTAPRWRSERVRRCSAAGTPRWAALMRRAASLLIIVVGPKSDWPIAAPMIRLSGTAGSSPCSTSRCLRMLLISICSVVEPLPVGTGAASEPPWATRSSSSVRSAVRAARPTSSVRLLSPSSSSTTVSGITTSASANSSTQVGSAIRTEVSTTSRVRWPPFVLSAPLDTRWGSSVGASADGKRSVTSTPQRKLVDADRVPYPTRRRSSAAPGCRGGCGKSPIPARAR
jgi:hypothetical protein